MRYVDTLRYVWLIFEVLCNISRIFTICLSLQLSGLYSWLKIEHCIICIAHCLHQFKNLHSKNFVNTKRSLIFYRFKEESFKKSVEKRKCFSFNVSYPTSKRQRLSPQIRRTKLKLMFQKSCGSSDWVAFPDFSPMRAKGVQTQGPENIFKSRTMFYGDYYFQS